MSPEETEPDEQVGGAKEEAAHVPEPVLLLAPRFDGLLEHGAQDEKNVVPTNEQVPRKDTS